MLLDLLLELINALSFTIVGDPSELPPFWISSLMQQCSNVLTAAIDRESSNDWAMLDSASPPTWGASSASIPNRTPFWQLTWKLKKAVRRLGTMPKSVETAVTDVHRCDSVTWQACAGYAKHLQNRSVSSVHWKWDKLTQGQRLVLHFAILHLVRTRVE